METVNTVEPVETVQTVFNEDLKKYELLTHLLSDNLLAHLKSSFCQACWLCCLTLVKPGVGWLEKPRRGRGGETAGGQ